MLDNGKRDRFQQENILMGFYTIALVKRREKRSLREQNKVNRGLRSIGTQCSLKS